MFKMLDIRSVTHIPESYIFMSLKVTNQTSDLWVRLLLMIVQTVHCTSNLSVDDRIYNNWEKMHQVGTNT
jgi:hypothetical protein